MKKNSIVLALLSVCASLAGCARFSTHQTDTSYDDQGKPARSITTRAAAYTFWDSQSALSSFKASQTDKTQSASVGALNQQSSATNLAPIFEAIGRGVVTGLK